ncbi:MAG: tetratricopeptide repeat protein [Candidatus Methanoperedens sp.]|nr:tetratricopeptide repeat protein [Candidatus Methanoperedens sp.]
MKCLNDLGYPSNFIQEISEELNKLFKEIDFESIRQRANQAAQVRDTVGLIKSIKDLMFLLEGKSIYRPDAPVHLIKLLVNGLNLKNQDIFYIISRSGISLEEKLEEMEFLASCAAITQLGYILLKCIVPDVKAASSGEHVFLVIESFSQDSNIFVDFSIDSVREITINIYDRNENNWMLKKDQDFSPMGTEIAQYLTEYYSVFHLTSGFGLNHNIHNNLGLAYDKIGRYDEAIDELHAALRLDSDYIEVHNNLAVTYHKMGMTVEAEKELKEAIRQNPGYLEAHCNLGNIYSTQGRLEEALFEINEALGINPDHAGAHNNLGNIYVLQKKNPEAINEFREALRIDPNYASPHTNIGNLFLESGMYEGAIKEFKEALDLDPLFPEAHYGTGLAHYELKNYEKASQAFIKAVNTSPELLDCIPDKLIIKVKQGLSRLG